MSIREELGNNIERARIEYETTSRDARVVIEVVTTTLIRLDQAFRKLDDAWYQFKQHIDNSDDG